MGQRIAIIGTGISGLGAAWALHRENEVVVFEADHRVGGHSNTVDVAIPEGGTIPVDTGFIVYNEVTYPNLTRLFGELAVPTEQSDMSFAYSLDQRFEYGASLKGVLAQPSNFGRGRFRQMLLDINRFRRTGTSLGPRPDETIQGLLIRNGFSDGFMDDYLFPMAAAIWSARDSEIRQFPARSILAFLSNHGLISIVGRPKWRTVSGGSRTYVDSMTRSFRSHIRTSTPVTHIDRGSDGVTVETRHGRERFDHVVIATHTDQALAILGDAATYQEIELLKSIPYEPNLAVLHSDVSLMPANGMVWSSWNAMATSDRQARRAAITYWMNRLQNLRTDLPLFVSLNPVRPPDDALVHASFEYSHPQFHIGSISAQNGLAEIQGLNRTWFAGAYLGYGFHEDGLQSGFNVAAALGSPVPWHGAFQPMSSAPLPERLELV